MRLLFAEDDRDLASAVKALLEHAGYAVDTVYNGEDAMDYALNGAYDGLILDWMMPKLSGVQVLKGLRERRVTVPTLMLTARDAVEDRVTGLDAGADDYLAKPFAANELLARVRALLRRKADYAPDVLRFADIELNRGEMTLRRGEKGVKLSSKAFQLMEMLMEHPSIVHGVDQIMERIWGWDSDTESNVVWVNISFLRKKLKELDSRVEIRATRGAGYSLEGK